MKPKPDKLYHFTRSDIAINKILPARKLRMNYLSFMNDPQENLYHIVNDDNNIIEKSISDLVSFEYFFAETIRNEAKVLAFTIDKEASAETTKIYGYQFQRMWATYGQNNTGICLEIDYNSFFKENEDLIMEFNIIDDFVKYNQYNCLFVPPPLYGLSPENQKGKITLTRREYFNSLISEKLFVENRFFSKNKDWEGESEYRFISFHGSSEELLLSIEKSLRRVIIGINFSKHFLPSVFELVPRSIVNGIELITTEGIFETRILE